MCVRRSWVLAGGRYQIRLPSRAATNGPVANSGGSRRKRRISSGALFYNRRHVTPKGCWCSVEQDHQFLNKISTNDENQQALSQKFRQLISSVEITIKMKTIVRKPLMIKINKLCLRNLENYLSWYSSIYFTFEWEQTRF